jgi:hypothetical protein
MTHIPHTGGLPHAQYERFESVRELEDMFDALVGETQRVIRVFDRSLSGRYDTLGRCDLLRQFLRADPLNELLIVVHDPANIASALPRFAALLQQFGHAAHVRQTPLWARHVHDPFAIFDASHYLHRFHVDQMRFARGRNDIAGAQTLLDRHQELWEASRPAAPPTTLGL